MIEKQEKYFEKDFEDDKFFIIHRYSGEKVKLEPYNPYLTVYSSENLNEVAEPDEVPEIEIKLVTREEVKDRLAEFVVLKEVQEFKYLVEKEYVSGADRVMILQWYNIPLEEWKGYLDEPLDSFFERFKIRS